MDLNCKPTDVLSGLNIEKCVLIATVKYDKGIIDSLGILAIYTLTISVRANIFNNLVLPLDNIVLP